MECAAHYVKLSDEPEHARSAKARQGSLRDRRNPAARSCSGEDVRLGDPQGAARPARAIDAGRGRADLDARRRRRARPRDGGRRQLQRRLGGARRADLDPSTCTSSPITSPGSDASGIVWAVGSKVKRWKVGDEVVVHCNQDDGDDEECNGGDPMFSPSQRIWGYETPDGSFAQFCRVQSRQLMARPKHLTWEEAACYTLTLATAYRMLFGHEPHRLKPGRQRAGLGRLGRPRRVRRAALRGRRAPTPSASSPTRRSATTSCRSAPRASSTARTSTAGASCRRSIRPNTPPR